MAYLPEVTSVRACGPTSLQVAFDDGTRKRVDVGRFLKGPIFKPLRDPAYFRKAMLDTEAGTVVWPNGADIAPETLYEMESEPEAAPPRRNRPAKPASQRPQRGTPPRKR